MRSVLLQGLGREEVSKEPSHTFIQAEQPHSITRWLSKPLPAKAGRLLFRLKVDLRLKPPEGLPAGSGLKATAGALL